MTSRPIGTGILVNFLALAAALGLSGSAAAHPGTGIVVDRQGRVYFTDLKRIWRIEPDRRPIAAIRTTHTHALAWDSGSQLVCESDGLLAIDRNGNRYVDELNNHQRDISRIWRISPRGDRSLFAGGPWGRTDARGTAARLGSVGGLAVGPDGFVYFTDGNAVRKISPEGEVTTIIAGGTDFEADAAYARYGGLANHLMGLAVDAWGNIYVANYGNRRLLKITFDRRTQTVGQSEPPWSPTGVTVSGRDVLSLEYDTTSLQRVRVRKISPDGTMTTLALIGN